VLSGGGALGAYETGVLRVLETVRLRPTTLAGVSVGAINALLWLAHDCKTDALVETWRTLRPAGIGLRWTTLAVRAFGMLLFTLSALEVILTLAGSPELGIWRWLRGNALGSNLSSVLLDVLAWIVVGLTGALLGILSRRVEDVLARIGNATKSVKWHLWSGRLLLALGVMHVIAWGTGLPWPHRFSASVLLAGGAFWLSHRPGRTGDWLRGLLIRMLPETGGRGAWGSAARRQLIQSVVAKGSARRLIRGDTRLLISSCVLDTGRMCYFINWPDPTDAFRERVEKSLGEVRVMRRPRDVIRAAVASSALPLIYEPVRIDGRDYVDGAVFANQPLRVLVPEEADAVLVVLLSPSSPMETPERDAHLVDLGGRLIEMANWRDLQAELGALPDDWQREPSGGKPARVCVVEPREALPGGVLGFDPANAETLMAMGEADALEALGRAGWLEDAATARKSPA
jgi:predicted acylesterase/phospholipase RssA